MRPLFTAKLLQRHEVNYFICDESGLIQTEEPYWLEEAYSSAISEMDTGLVQRNGFHCEQLKWLIDLFEIDGKYLDLGGGYGLLARLMRDAGFDYYTTDPYCQNLFAAGWEPEPGFKAGAMTAFEVMEHIRDPYRFVADAFAKYDCRTLIFSTVCYGDKLPDLDWWYWSLETGQHITIYHERTLRLLAEKLGVSFYSMGDNLHVFSDCQLGRLGQLSLRYAWLKNLRLKYGQRFRRRRRCTFTWQDRLTAKARVNEGTSGKPLATP